MEKTRELGLYKPSRFNAMTRTEADDLVIYNSMRGGIYRLSPPTNDQVHELLHNRNSALRRPEKGTPDARVFDELIRRGFLVPEDSDEFMAADELRETRKNRTDRLELILMPTEACNFRCTYCYEDFALGRMLSSVREGVRELVRGYHAANGIERLTVAWFGGEPLVAFEVIEELSRFFLDFCAEAGISYEAGITTNGYLLTPEVARRCHELSIRNFQITIDGPRTTHDASRFLMGGEGTYDDIMRNIRTMQTLPGEFNVLVRTNFTEESSGRTPELIEELGAAVGHDPRFKVIYRPVGGWGGPNDEEVGAYAGKEAELTKLALCQEAAHHGMLTADDRILGPNGSVCYAASPWSFVIRPNGLVNKCTVALRDPRNAVGRLAEDGDLNLDPELMRLWTDSDETTDSGCRSCFFRPSCQGAHCPLVRIQEGERPCPPQKVWIGPTIETFTALKRRGERR